MSFAAVLRVVAATGMRRGEVCALRWRDVDFDNSVVRISETVVAAMGGAIVKAPKTRPSIRTVAIDSGTMSVLRDVRTKQTVLADTCGLKLAPEAPPVATSYLSNILPVELSSETVCRKAPQGDRPVLRKLVVVAALLPCMSATLVATSPSTGAASAVTVESNLCYQASGGSCVDGVNHEFDAYLPSGATQATPGVILIHGGSFIGGDKSGLANIASKLAADGMAAFSINYRLDSSTVVGYPMESQDVMAAISYIRANASSFNVDPTRLASFGSSAGATLAVYSAMKAYQSDPSARVVADVGWSGGYDFTVGTSGAVDQGQLQNIEYYLGCSDPTDPACAATAEAASAISLVEVGEAPTLLANSTDYGVGCEIVPPSQAQEMASDLKNVGVPVQLDLNSECAHATAYANIELAPTITFLEAHLFPPTTTVVLPANGATLSGTQTLDATTSSGVTGVTYELSGGSLTDSVIATATPTIYGWLASWNSTSVPNGTYTLQSVASYQGGVSGTSAALSITVAN